MNYDLYLDKFEKVAAGINKKTLIEKKIEVETGIWLDSVVLRLQKKHWANKPYAKPQSDSSIFMGIWLNDKTIKDNRIFYNIHALKLRQLNGYSLKSREFAAAFRNEFKHFKKTWPNVSVDFGPQTLMQGWREIDPEHLQKDIRELVNKFLELDGLIDDLLSSCKLKLPAY